MTPRSGNPVPTHAESVPAFAAVGIAATLVHASIGLTLHGLGLSAFLANLVAFSVAFLVSYFGHRRFSFRSQASHRKTLPRFGVVAGTGLLLNQGLVLALVNAAGLNYAIGLAVIVVTVPAVTYVLSRLWAFG